MHVEQKRTLARGFLGYWPITEVDLHLDHVFDVKNISSCPADILKAVFNWNKGAHTNIERALSALKLIDRKLQ